MYRINPKPWLDRTTPTSLAKTFEFVPPHYQQVKVSNIFNQPPKRPYNEAQQPSELTRKESLDQSPVQKSKALQDQTRMLNPTYRSANFTKSNEPLRQSSANCPSKSQSFRSSDKSLKYDSSASQDFPLLTKESTLPFYEPTKCSSNQNGIIKAYAANTNQGIIRDYNEDRVSIILNIVKPQSRNNENWPKCSFFGVYDGHGGANCADFLRDNLHQFVIREPDFPWNPTEALRKGFEQAEKHFLELALQSYARGTAERSGSCAIVCLIVGDQCYIANVGDSRGIMSSQKGQQVYTLSRDHKPCDDLEQQRIQAAGGKIYQTQAYSGDDESQIILGPMRVLPGRLSVSRTFGDIEAKLEKFGGNIKVVVAEPEIRNFKIQPEHDFIVLASDGIFDKMSSNDVLRTVWEDLSHPSSQTPQVTLHGVVSSAVEAVLKESINRRTYDNITVVMVAFSKEDEQQRIKTSGSVEREQKNNSISPTPLNKVPYNGYSQRDEKSYFKPQAPSKSLLNYNKQLRTSYDSIDYQRKVQQQTQAQQPQIFSFMKPSKEQAKQPKLQQAKKNHDDQENLPFNANKLKEMKQSSMHMELKMSNDFRQLKRPIPLQIHELGNRYQGRIF